MHVSLASSPKGSLAAEGALQLAAPSGLPNKAKEGEERFPMSRSLLKEVVLTALFVALVAIATMAIKIPTGATQGYLNVGEAVIFCAALWFGPRTGAIAGGLGSALADVLTGYAVWAPWTLIIKGTEGLLVGLLAHRAFVRRQALSPRTVGAMVAGAIWMVLGYYLASVVVLQGFAPALATIPENGLQGLASVVLGAVLVRAFRGVKGLVGQH